MYSIRGPSAKTSESLHYSTKFKINRRIKKRSVRPRVMSSKFTGILKDVSVATWEGEGGVVHIKIRYANLLLFRVCQVQNLPYMNPKLNFHKTPLKTFIERNGINKSHQI
jgi:hypothetical protein